MPMRSSRTEMDALNVKGAKLRSMREASGVSQAEFARQLQRAGWDIDIMVLSRIELGKRTLTDVEIQKLLNCLGRKWADLD